MREAIAAKLEPGPTPFGRSAASASLPSYALYGEHGQTKAIDWMHCERIAERSQRHDWEIRPHRHASLFQILHIERGAAQAWLEAGNQALVGPCVLLVPALVPHGFVFAPDIEGTVITLLEQHLLRLLQRAPALADRLVQTRWLAWPAADPQGQALHDAVARLREAFAQAAPWRDLALDAALLHLAVMLGVKPGDKLLVEALEGRRAVVRRITDRMARWLDELKSHELADEADDATVEGGAT